tara:strand:+ start:2093 stop:2449 length:357 start_codon:yes stop_codon:yes gene_type:complete
MSFTLAEVKKCTILLAEQIFKDNLFVEWSFIVMDGYGQTYSWTESSQNLNYATTPTDENVSSYVSDYLQGNAHATGGGSYTAPTQITSVARVNQPKSKGSVTSNRVPGKQPAPPGNPT